jgi:hypothetical protein
MENHLIYIILIFVSGYFGPAHKTDSPMQEPLNPPAMKQLKLRHPMLLVHIVVQCLPPFAAKSVLLGMCTDTEKNTDEMDCDQYNHIMLHYMQVDETSEHHQSICKSIQQQVMSMEPSTFGLHARAYYRKRTKCSDKCFSNNMRLCWLYYVHLKTLQTKSGTTQIKIE